MVKSRQTIFRRIWHSLYCALLLSIFSAAFASVASAQFTLTVSSPLPSAVVPGSTATAALNLQPNGSSLPVTLTCVVTTTIAQPVMPPTCDPSPSTPITPPASPSLTITTFSGTSFGLYNFAVTGTNGSSTVTVNLSANRRESHRGLHYIRTANHCHSQPRGAGSHRHCYRNDLPHRQLFQPFHYAVVPHRESGGSGCPGLLIYSHERHIRRPSPNHIRPGVRHAYHHHPRAHPHHTAGA